MIPAPGAPRTGKSSPLDRAALLAAWALVLVVYGLLAAGAEWPRKSEVPADSYYGLLADGFRSGQLALKKEVPAGFSALRNPYEPATNGHFRMQGGLHDMSYYGGKLHLYFGVTPAAVLFLPSAILGGTLSDAWAVAIFSAVGFSAGAWILCAMRRKFFPEVGAVGAATGLLAFGLASGVPLQLMRPLVYEVSMMCGSAMVMLALACAWQAVMTTGRRSRWLLLASAAYGLALGSRPSLLFGAVILLVPVVAEWRSQVPWRRLTSAFTAAVVPIGVIGVALLFYNYVRFGNPFEFGQRYQLVSNHQSEAPYVFSPSFFRFNFRLYFLEPMQWENRFPFILGIRQPAGVPAYHLGVENPFGVLASIPIVWLAAALPLSWRGRSTAEAGILKTFLLAPGLLFAACALTLCFFGGVCGRYEVEFLPGLVFLAVAGFWGMERTWTSQPMKRTLARAGWGLALAASIAFNALVGCGPLGPFPARQNNIGYALLESHRLPEAIVRFRRAVRYYPDFSEAHCNLGTAFFEMGEFDEAQEHFREAVRINPAFAVAQNNLGIALMRSGRLDEAKAHFEQILRRDPRSAEARQLLNQVEMKLRAETASPGVKD